MIERRLGEICTYRCVESAEDRGGAIDGLVQDYLTIMVWIWAAIYVRGTDLVFELANLCGQNRLSPIVHQSVHTSGQ